VECRKFYRADSVMTVAKRISSIRFRGECRKSDGTEVAPSQQANIHFSAERRMRIMNYVRFLFVYKRIISSVKRAESVSDRMSYIILRGRWRDIIVLNVHVPVEDKIDDMDSFYEELERVFNKCSKYHSSVWV
jgi:hypothetical protein